MEGISVHKVKLPGSKWDRYVNCLREYNDPMDKCPFCKAGIRTEARLFVPMYNVDDDQVQLWDKGKTMFSKMSSLCSRYASNGKKLVNSIFEIERNGKPNDTNTTYEIYYVESDDTTLEDLPQPKPVCGPDKCLVLEKTAEEMEYFLSHGDFPVVQGQSVSESRNTDDEMPIRRRSERRTPATSGGEAF